MNFWQKFDKLNIRDIRCLLMSIGRDKYLDIRVERYDIYSDNWIRDSCGAENEI